MKGLIVAVAASLMASLGMAAAQEAAPPLNAAAARSLSDFQNFGPHRAFVIGADWRAEVPARSADAPDIGRLRPEPYWSMRGPKLAAGLIVWSHGYMAGKNATSSAPQPWIGRFTRMGYDLYRFDREWIVDWAGDAT